MPGTVEDMKRRMRHRKRQLKKAWKILGVTWPPEDRGKTVAFQPDQSVYERIRTLKEKHGMRSLKEAAYKAMLFGLDELESVPPSPE
jgi:hypothetical protein